MDSEETTGQYAEQFSQKFEFALSRTDYERVLRWFLIWRHKWKRVLYPLIFLLGLVLLVEVEMMGRYAIEVPWFIYLCPVITFGLPIYTLWFVPFWAARSIFRSLNSTQVSCVISESGLESAGLYFSGHIEWPA